MSGNQCLQPEAKDVVQAREYLGPGDPTQESLQYVLESAAAARGHAHDLPYLPTGNLVSGLPAALLSCCQARSPVIYTTFGSYILLALCDRHGGWHVCQAKVAEVLWTSVLLLEAK